MKKKRVLYLHRTQGMGAEGSHIRGMVGGFREHGLKVDIVGPPGIDPYLFQNKSDGKLKCTSRILSWFADRAPQICFEIIELLYNGFAWWQLRRKWHNEKGYDFIYERYALNSFAGILFASGKGVKLVLEVNDATIIERSRPLFLKNVSRKIEAFVLNKADVVITITNHFKELLVNNYKLKSSKIIVLPNAINLQDYILKDSEKFQRSWLNIPQKAIVLGCVGAFVPWHGLEFLLDSIACESQKHRLFFLFVGDGPVRKQVEEKARILGLEKSILFTGFVSPEKVPYYLDLIDICVIPQSNAHCSPMKLFEYMAAKKAIVLPSYQPLLDTVLDKKEALFFKHNSSIELRRVLLTLVSSIEKRQELGKNAYDAVSSKYTWYQNTQVVLLSPSLKIVPV